MKSCEIEVERVNSVYNGLRKITGRCFHCRSDCAVNTEQLCFLLAFVFIVLDLSEVYASGVFNFNLIQIFCVSTPH